MADFVRGSSSIFRLEAHISFKIKYCHKVFDIKEFSERCRELLLEASAEIGVHVTEIGFDRDHVHLTISWLRIDLSLSDISKKLKGTTGRKLLTEFPQIKRRFFWGSGLWGGQIYGDSLGRKPDELHRYVANQGNDSRKYSIPLTRFFNQNTTSL